MLITFLLYFFIDFWFLGFKILWWNLQSKFHHKIIISWLYSGFFRKQSFQKNPLTTSKKMKNEKWKNTHKWVGVYNQFSFCCPDFLIYDLQMSKSKFLFFIFFVFLTSFLFLGQMEIYRKRLQYHHHQNLFAKY